MADPTLTLTHVYSPTYAARIGYTLPVIADTDSPYPVISTVDGVFPSITPTWPTCATDGTQTPSGTQVYFNTLDGKRTYYFHASTAAVAELMIYEGLTLVYSGSTLTSYANWAAYNAVVGSTLYVDLPTALLQSNTEYTFSLRVTVTSNHQWEYWQQQVDRWDHWECPQYVAQSQSSGWGSTTGVVNGVPVVSNTQTNGQTNPKISSTSSVSLMFDITDDDGPTMKYSIQAGPVTPSGFEVETEMSADVGRVVGGRSFSVPYVDEEGPFVGNVQYAWKVMADDGYTYGDGKTAWSQLNYFRVNALPYVISLKMGGLELLSGVNQKIGGQDALVEWVYVDPEGATQTAYRMMLTPQAGGTPLVYEASGSASSFTIGLITPGIYNVSFAVKDDMEYGNASVGIITVNAKPRAVSLEVDGEVNPSNVGTVTPTLEWTFQDDDAADSQQKYRVQVASDPSFQALVWDTGEVVGASDNIVYGAIPGTIPPVALVHAKYYFRVWVYDGTSWSYGSLGYASFYVNTPPGDPTLTAPSAGTYSGILTATWVPASPLDPDGDDVTYIVEMTSSFSYGTGWEQVAGPLPSTATSCDIDVSAIKGGDDYAVRVTASDGITRSDPSSGGTSPRFSVANHNPTTPTFTGPAVGSTQALRILAEWQEADPVDVDDDAIIYKIWLTQDGGSTWELVQTIPSGNTRAVIDTIGRDGGTCNLRIAAVDENGGQGEYKYSGEFQLDNSSAATDFEKFNGTMYVSTIDGRLRKAIGRNWTFEESWQYGPPTEFDVFAEGSPVVTVKDGKMYIKPVPGSTFILRQD